jgi:hypothetical protein
MSSETVEAVEENRTHLETLAESDLACAWIAEALLEATDDDGRSGHE